MTAKTVFANRCEDTRWSICDFGRDARHLHQSAVVYLSAGINLGARHGKLKRWCTSCSVQSHKYISGLTKLTKSWCLRKYSCLGFNKDRTQPIKSRTSTMRIYTWCN